MVVDPYLIHAYWDIDVNHLPAGTKSAVLRFHDASETPGPSFDVDVDLRAPNWYVPLWSPAKSYHADLGVTTTEGEFIPLAASNPIQTPRAWPAAEVPKPIVEQAPLAPAVLPPAAKQHPPARIPEPPVRLEESPAPIPTPKPLYADEVLHQKLAEIYALRSWRSRPAVAMAAASSEPLFGDGAPSAAPQPHVVERSRKSDLPAPAQVAIPADLTALAERRFSPGLPSSPVFKETPLPT